MAPLAWKARAQGTVDNAQMRYFIVHLHRLLDQWLPQVAALPQARRVRYALDVDPLDIQ